MSYSTIRRIHDLGQSIWLDALDRKMLYSGKLKELIHVAGIRGITSNPSIFEKAINHSNDYTDDIKELSKTGKSNEEIFFSLAFKDISQAADLFTPVYDEGIKGSDGFVSLEVSPELARSESETVMQARYLWKSLDHQNVMIKIPRTKECLPAIRECIRDGININITLLFSIERYKAVAEAYIAALEERLKDKKPISSISSVASFFLSRIDAMTDPLLEAKGRADLKGGVAIACAKEAYKLYQEIFSSDRFARLRDEGAKPQRLLWASTRPKDPHYSDIKYVEALIAPETVNTLPLKTLEAYLDHGHPEIRLEDDLEKAEALLAELDKLGIDLGDITGKLEAEGIEKFRKPYKQLLTTIEQQRSK